MPAYTLERRQVVPGALEQVFTFFKDPQNLATITPRWLNFRVRHATDAPVREGTRISYDISWLGLPMRWESLITEYVERERFADQMLRGPYARWYHVHTFREVAGGIEVGDRVEYAMPLGLLGTAAHTVMVRRQLNSIFDFRTRALRRLFGTAHDSAFSN